MMTMEVGRKVHGRECFAPAVCSFVFASHLVLLCGGCAQIQSGVDQLKTSAAAAFSAIEPASDASTAPRLAGSGLEGVFKRYPLGSAQARDNYPRAAITIVSATPSILKLGKSTPDQCIRFNVRLWSDPKFSRMFDGLQMCASDKSFGVPFRTLTYWPNTFVTGETTGAVRTEGPARPKTNFPTEPRVANAWFESNTQGIFYIGSILYQMGYDWDQPGEHRAWFVSAPAP